MSDGADFEQTRFSDGKVVPDSQHSGRDDLVHPNEETGFRLAIKPDALEVNQPLVDLTDEHGEVITFATRAKADVFAERLSTADGDLRVQAAAQNDPDDVDAYLLTDHQPAVSEPASVNGDTMTFDVGANLYGALGEAVVKGGPTSPALEYFVKRDVSDVAFRNELRVRVTDGEFLPFDDAGVDGRGWTPDCRVEVRDGWRGRLVETYYCEIKTGDASFERTQVATMREVARDERVLKLRVLIDRLPNRYAVRIREVEADE